MAKKSFISLVLCLFAITGMAYEPEVQFGSQVYLSVMSNEGGILNPGNGNPSIPRGPVLVPDVSLDSHTLYLYNVGYDLTLVLLDEDDEVAYTAFIPANTASVVLPATLSGDYEMQLYPGGSYYFYGWVEL